VPHLVAWAGRFDAICTDSGVRAAALIELCTKSMMLQSYWSLFESITVLTYTGRVKWPLSSN